MNNNTPNEKNYVTCKIVSTNDKYDGLIIMLSLEDFIQSLESTHLKEATKVVSFRHRIQEF